MPDQPSDAGPRIILVGHCGPDAYALRSAVSRMADGASVQFAADEQALQAEIPRADLLLINRLLDGDYARSTGLELIRDIAASDTPDKPAMMLISNFADAQADAVSAGASPGFGKKDMYSEETRKRVLAALGR